MFDSSILNKFSDFFCANFYSNTMSLQLIWEKSRWNLANFTEKTIFALILHFFLHTSAICAIFAKFHVCDEVVIVVLVVIVIVVGNELWWGGGGKVVKMGREHIVITTTADVCILPWYLGWFDEKALIQEALDGRFWTKFFWEFLDDRYIKDDFGWNNKKIMT